MIADDSMLRRETPSRGLELTADPESDHFPFVGKGVVHNGVHGDESLANSRLPLNTE
jgi:hypothetical protein